MSAVSLRQWYMDDRTDRERLDDIQRYAADAINTLGDATYAEFLNDSNLRHSVFYLVAIVGEAAAKTSPATRRLYPAIPWRQVRGMRNILIHEYHSVKPESIYQAVVDFLPTLISALETTTDNSQGGQPS